MRRTATAVVVLLLATAATAAPIPGAVNEETVRQIASQLRCVVCQNLSVADSPSEMANQMRALIRERLAAGDRPEQVIAYFVDKYGEWILLTPRPRGFNLLVWVVPFAGTLAGLAAIVVLMRRWTRRAAAEAKVTEMDPAVRDRIRREMAELEP